MSGCASANVIVMPGKSGISELARHSLYGKRVMRPVRPRPTGRDSGNVNEQNMISMDVNKDDMPCLALLPRDAAVALAMCLIGATQ